MGGKVIKSISENNGLKISRSEWIADEQMRAMAYDSQTAGYNTFNTVSVRLWTALPIFGNEQKVSGPLNVNLKKTEVLDQYKNIIQIRKQCEKIICAPYPKDPN